MNLLSPQYSIPAVPVPTSSVKSVVTSREGPQSSFPRQRPAEQRGHETFEEDLEGDATAAVKTAMEDEPQVRASENRSYPDLQTPPCLHK